MGTRAVVLIRKMILTFSHLPSCFSWLKRLWKRKCCGNKIAASGELNFSVEDYLENERAMEPLGDFTLSEYNEKGKRSTYHCRASALMPWLHETVVFSISVNK